MDFDMHSLVLVQTTNTKTLRHLNMELSFLQCLSVLPMPVSFCQPQNMNSACWV